MSDRSYTARYVHNGYSYDAPQLEGTLLSAAILVISAVAIFHWSWAPLHGFASHLLLLLRDLTVQIIPAQTLFALYQRVVGGSADDEKAANASIISLHEKKRLALSTIFQKLAKSDAVNSLIQLPLNPLNAALLSPTVRGNSEKPPGLANPSNSCFQNSILQGLASLHSFQDFLRKTSAEFNFPRDSTNGALAWLLQNLNDPEFQGRTLWTPLNLMPMNIIQQQDAQEYFSRIMESMERELSQRLKSMQIPHSAAGLKSALFEAHQHPPASSSLDAHAETGSNSLPLRQCDRNGEKQIAITLENQQRNSQESSAQNYLSNAPSLKIQNPVDGLLAQRLVCTKCQYSEGISLVPFNALTVPLGKITWKPYEVFEECLHEYLKEEELEGVECGKCTLLAQRNELEGRLKDVGFDQNNSYRKLLDRMQEALAAQDFCENTLVKKLGLEKKSWSRTTKIKHLAIARSPKALIIHIQRSSFNPLTYRQEKNNSPVKFPTHQDVSCFSLEGRDSMCKNVDAESGSTEDRAASASPPEGFNVEAEMRPSNLFALRAVVGHSGVHDYGHYVCFRKFRPSSKTISKHPSDAHKPQLVVLRCSGCHQLFEESSDSLPDQIRMEIESERWWRLSDESVWEVSEDNVTQQTNAYMLFYERCNPWQSAEGRQCQDCMDGNLPSVHDATADTKAAELTTDINGDRPENEHSESDTPVRATRDLLGSSEPSDFSPSTTTNASIPLSITESIPSDPRDLPACSETSESSSLRRSSAASHQRPTSHPITESSIHGATRDAECGRQLMTPPRTPDPWSVADGPESNKALVEAR